MATSTEETVTPSIPSLLDTDLYKLTMQCALLRFFPSVPVEYTFTNRTPQMRLTRGAYRWLKSQILSLSKLRLQDSELAFLRRRCPYLDEKYLGWLKEFRLNPSEQVDVRFDPVDTDQDDDEKDETRGDLHIHISGSWIDTILYEVPILALTSEAYFRFVDTDWSYDSQESSAYEKGLRLFEAGCQVSEFGSRRRRDGHTHDLVVAGLKRASEHAASQSWTGKLTGTSNVYFAYKHDLAPVGTVAHEWYMGIASIEDDYANANESGLRYWVECFGEGVLGIALTDTFGTPAFFDAFAKKSPKNPQKTYAEIFTGVRQDSGDPKEYVALAAKFYESQNLTNAKKSIVFSDSLNVERCLEYKTVAEHHGFAPSFGVGTFFTNDFSLRSDSSRKSKPLNIVIKISKAGGRPSVKISDNISKNTGDRETVTKVKRILGYEENEWKEGDESKRW